MIDPRTLPDGRAEEGSPPNYFNKPRDMLRVCWRRVCLRAGLFRSCVVVCCLCGEGEFGGEWAVEDDAVGPFDEQGHIIGGDGEFQPVSMDESVVEPT